MIDKFVLEGSVVRLEALDLRHVEGLAAAASESRDTYAFAHLPERESAMASAVAMALRERDDGRRVPFATCKKGSGAVIGSTSFSDIELWHWPGEDPDQQDGRPHAVEIGSTWLSSSAQRTGANAEAKYLMMRHAFETWQAHRVRCRTDERNRRSRYAIARLGTRFDGLLRGDKPGADGSLRSSAYYSVLAEEWPGVRALLEDRLERHTHPAPPLGTTS